MTVFTTFLILLDIHQDAHDKDNWYVTGSGAEAQCDWQCQEPDDGKCARWPKKDFITGKSRPITMRDAAGNALNGRVLEVIYKQSQKKAYSLRPGAGPTDQ